MFRREMGYTSRGTKVCRQIDGSNGAPRSLPTGGAFFVFVGRSPEMHDQRDAEDDMDYYLLEHPTAMPVREAAMTYLFTAEPRLLTLVPAQDGGVATIDEQAAARKSA